MSSEINSQKRLLRLKDFLGAGKVIPVSKSTWWAGVKSGRYPAPIKIGQRAVAWKADDIARLAETGVQPRSKCPRRG